MKLKNYILAISIMLISIVGFGNHVFAAVDCTRNDLSTQQAVQCGVNGASGKKDPDPAAAADNLNNTIKSGINIASAAVGVAAVVMIIIGGFRYITSGGKQETVTGAKNTIVYAVVGLVVVALAQIIVHFVIQNVSTS